MNLGTRGSALALWQANWAKAELEKHWPGLTVELVPIKTTGDKILDVPLANIVMLRGNVDTRLRKLEAGEYDGIILAVAGLKRLGHASRITQILDDDVMVSAVGQGALGIVCRTGDAATIQRLQPLDHNATRT